MKRGTKKLHTKKTPWDSVRAKLKVRFERAGITRCEICGADNFLGFAHCVKRRKLRADAEVGSPEHIETVVLLCNEPCHLRIERMQPEEMSTAVMALIAKRKVQPNRRKNASNSETN
jgi:hypothetical protein